MDGTLLCKILITRGVAGKVVEKLKREYERKGYRVLVKNGNLWVCVEMDKLLGGGE